MLGHLDFCVGRQDLGTGAVRASVQALLPKTLISSELTICQLCHSSVLPVSGVCCFAARIPAACMIIPWGICGQVIQALVAWAMLFLENVF